VEGHAADADEGDGERDEQEAQLVAALEALADEGEAEEGNRDATEGVKELGDVVRLDVVRFAPGRAGRGREEEGAGTGEGEEGGVDE
jgi:hypothetical protein